MRILLATAVQILVGLFGGRTLIRIVAHLVNGRADGLQRGPVRFVADRDNGGFHVQVCCCYALGKGQLLFDGLFAHVANGRGFYFYGFNRFLRECHVQAQCGDDGDEYVFHFDII